MHGDIEQWLRAKVQEPVGAVRGRCTVAPLEQYDLQEQQLCTEALKIVFTSRKGEVLYPTASVLPPLF